MDNSSTPNEAYRKANKKAKFRDLKFAFLVIVALIPSGVLLDLANDSNTEENFYFYLKVRLFFLFLFFLLYIFYKTRKSYHSVVHIEYVIMILTIAFLDYMVYFSGGVVSPHVIGFNLLLFGGSFILAQRPMDSIIGGVSILVSYVFIYTHTEDFSTGDSHFHEFLNNLYFIFGTAVLAVIASFYNEGWRIKQFNFRYMTKVQNGKLLELSQVKSNLFDSLSHEFRHPITLIKAVSDEINSDKETLISQDKLHVLKKSSDQLLSLVSDMLDISKLEKGQKLELKAIDIIIPIKSTIKMMGYLANSQNIKLTYKGPSDLVLIEGNYHALEKIFINLLNNALKFTKTGGKVHFDVVLNESDITITVSDNGVGISEDDLEFIFERFVQGKSTATLNNLGSGVGLSLVKDFTESMGGSVEVISQLGQGSAFILTFPYSDQWNRNEDYTIEELSFVTKANRSDVQSINIAPLQHNDTTVPLLLIVEDDQDLLNYLVEILQTDYQVIPVMDGASASTAIEKYKPDIVLTDWMLPNGSGIELCKKVKSNPEFEWTKVAILTARVSEESEKEALEAGVHDFITKPFSKVILKQRLSNLYKNLVLEREMFDRNNELNTMVTTLKSTKIQLIHSEKINALGSLAAGLLHEINNPLNYALVAAQLLRRDLSAKEKDQIEMLDDIYDGMDRIRNIVKDLHTFAHPNKAVKESVFNLNEAIKSAVRFSAHNLYNLDLNIDVDDSLKVIASQSHMIQVMINLLSNSTHALDGKKDGIIDIIATRIENDRVLIRFRDNGVGIDELSLSRIFDPFFTTKEVGDGLGMGLSICHTIIDNHDSVLEVESLLGEYTLFSFELALNTS
ncbi:MAG: response regulator [Thiotrichaceae bacterium]|nr:response regulator [Thiotrichaceae bacterium]